MTGRGSRVAEWDWMSPSAERLVSKITNLDELHKEFRARTLTGGEHCAVEACGQYLAKAREFIDRAAFSPIYPFFSRKHSHLVWELLHRVDEYHILLRPKEELLNKAIEVRTAFDLNIKEEKTRSDWIGPNGQLQSVLEALKNRPATESDRITVKEALQLVNEQMDRTYWQLSANTLTSVWSAVILGALMWLAWHYLSADSITILRIGGLKENVPTLIVLGLIGAYVSNLLSKEDFLYVRGGPFLRYWLHNLMVKPLMGAFAAVFIYVVEKSKLIFSINPVSVGGSNEAASQLITFNVSWDSVGYVYVVLAIASAFAADKLLRSTFDSVLKRMEQKAEKTADSAEKV